MEYIKVNLPSNEASYQSGNGEGCWALVSSAVKDIHDQENEVGTIYTAILDNTSIYYPGLDAGMQIPIELRGHYRPVVPLSWLVENFGESVW